VDTVLNRAEPKELLRRVAGNDFLSEGAPNLLGEAGRDALAVKGVHVEYYYRSIVESRWIRPYGYRGRNKLILDEVNCC
jgi:hypothetical protein